MRNINKTVKTDCYLFFVVSAVVIKNAGVPVPCGVLDDQLFLLEAGGPSRSGPRGMVVELCVAVV
jgi:hypothetical protein